MALSKAIVLAAMAVHNGEAAVAAIEPEPATRKRPAITGVSRSKYRNLRRRVDKLERHLLALRDHCGVDTPSC